MKQTLRLLKQTLRLLFSGIVGIIYTLGTIVILAIIGGITDLHIWLDGMSNKQLHNDPYVIIICIAYTCLFYVTVSEDVLFNQWKKSY